MKRTLPVPWFLLLAALALSAACQKQRDEPAEATPPPEPRTGPPLLDELQSLTFSGFEDPKAVTLQDGLWQGPAAVEGGASRPEVRLLGELQLQGDLDADGLAETVVFLNRSTGGTGQLLYLAVVQRLDGQARNVATAVVGDRVQVRGAGIESAQIVLHLVQPGPEDALCCPGELATRRWEWRAPEGLQELEGSGPTGRLALESIAGVEWVLRSWERDVPAPLEPEVTLRFAAGRLAGKNGCNDYFVAVSAGDMPGDLTLGPAGATRMACPGTAAAVENRFMQQLSGVKRYGFVLTRLALTYEVDGRHGVMLFEPRQDAPAAETP